MAVIWIRWNVAHKFRIGDAGQAARRVIRRNDALAAWEIAVWTSAAADNRDVCAPAAVALVARLVSVEETHKL